MSTTLQIQPTEELFEGWYNSYVEEWESDPTVITVHCIWDRYGGPEEGGWYFQCGEPIENICIFSKAQAIKELIRLHELYKEVEEENYDINFSNTWGEYYPKKRPHYC